MIGSIILQSKGSALEDKEITCKSCRFVFVFTAEAQERYAEKGFTQPKRCRECRANPDRSFEAQCAECKRSVKTDQQIDQSKPFYCLDCYPKFQKTRNFHEAACDQCQKFTTVPFKPVPGRPVYCPSCLELIKAAKEEMFHEATCDNCGGIAKVPFVPSAGSPVYCSNCFGQLGKPIVPKRVRPMETSTYVPPPPAPMRDKAPLIDRGGNSYSGKTFKIKDNGPAGMPRTNLFGKPDYRQSITGVPFGAGRRGGPQRGPGGGKLHRPRR